MHNSFVLTTTMHSRLLLLVLLSLLSAIGYCSIVFISFYPNNTGCNGFAEVGIGEDGFGSCIGIRSAGIQANLSTFCIYDSGFCNSSQPYCGSYQLGTCLALPFNLTVLEGSFMVTDSSVGSVGPMFSVTWLVIAWLVGLVLFGLVHIE